MIEKDGREQKKDRSGREKRPNGVFVRYHHSFIPKKKGIKWV